MPPDTAIPVAEGIDAQTGDEWSRPVAESGRGSPLLIYSLLLATFLGTMGLPHILVRFYTNPDGSAARRTTVRVLGLLGAFYLFPAVYGAARPRVHARALRHRRHRLASSCACPPPRGRARSGDILAAIVAAGAFAAFMSTASGLLVSIAGTVSHDVLRRAQRRRRRDARSAIAARRRHGRRPRCSRSPRASVDISRARRLGVRARREHVLPAAAARRLVAAPDRRGGGGRHARRRRAWPPAMITAGLIGERRRRTPRRRASSRSPRPSPSRSRSRRWCALAARARPGTWAR